EVGMRAAAGPAHALVGALARQERSLRAWQEDLQRAALSLGGFREQALTRDVIEAVLTDPKMPADQRVGAALALRTLDAPAATTRIRVAAEASANPRLRVALEATCADNVDEEAIDEALRAESAAR